MRLLHLFFCLLPGRWLLFCFLLFSGKSASAQLCQGSLGDPIVNITFGGGTNPGSPVGAAQGLQYVANDCPNDGSYTVRTVTNSCFGNTWHSIADHSDPGNGYFMLINASFQPSVFYLETVNNLCSGTTYEFAAWMVNMLRPTACNGNGIAPDVTFSIEKTDGTVIQSYNTGNISATGFPMWRQYGFFFTTPSGVSSVVLRITNNAPGGCGNDIGLDDITFRPCGPQVTAGIAGVNADVVSICQGNTGNYQLTALITGSTATAGYQWQRRIDGGAWADIAGATTTSYTTVVTNSTAAGMYEYRVGTADASNINSLTCRIYSKALTVTVVPAPEAIITPSSTACTGRPFLLKASGGGAYTWSGPNGFTSADSVLFFPSLQSAQNGVYTVIVSNSTGCTASRSFALTAQPAVNLTLSFADTTVCQQTPVHVSAAGGESYRWSPATGLSGTGIANPIVMATDTIRYRVVAANRFGCADTGYMQVNAIKKAIAHAGPDKVVIGNQDVVLEGSIRNLYSSFYWSPAAGLSDVRQLQPKVIATADAVYFLTAISPKGCGISIDTVSVKVYADIFIPSAFTPNGDGKNDVWNIPSLQAFNQFELLVYNRYGQLVFQSKNQYRVWDGKSNGNPLPAGAYVYSLSIAELKKTWGGTVLIIR